MSLTHSEWALVLIHEDRHLRYAAIAGMPEAMRRELQELGLL